MKPQIKEISSFKIIRCTKQFENRIEITRGASGKTRFSNQVTGWLSYVPILEVITCTKLDNTKHCHLVHHTLLTSEKPAWLGLDNVPTCKTSNSLLDTVRERNSDFFSNTTKVVSDRGEVYRHYQSAELWTHHEPHQVMQQLVNFMCSYSLSEEQVKRKSKITNDLTIVL